MNTVWIIEFRQRRENAVWKVDFERTPFGESVWADEYIKATPDLDSIHEYRAVKYVRQETADE